MCTARKEIPSIKYVKYISILLKCNSQVDLCQTIITSHPEESPALDIYVISAAEINPQSFYDMLPSENSL